MIEPASTALSMPAEIRRDDGEYAPCTVVLVFPPGEMELLRAGLNNHTIVNG